MSLFDQLGNVWTQSHGLQTIVEPYRASIAGKASVVYAWHATLRKSLGGGAPSVALAEASELDQALGWVKRANISNAVEQKTSYFDNASYSG